MTIDYHSGKFLLISFKVSLHEFILGFSHCVCGRRCTPMFHTEDRAAGKDKSLTFSRGPKGCHVQLSEFFPCPLFFWNKKTNGVLSQ